MKRTSEASGLRSQRGSNPPRALAGHAADNLRVSVSRALLVAALLVTPGAPGAASESCELTWGKGILVAIHQRLPFPDLSPGWPHRR